MRAKTWCLACCIIAVSGWIPLSAYAFSSGQEPEFERVLNRNGLSLESPSQKPLLQLLIDPKSFIGQKTYIVGMQYVSPAKKFPGAVVLMIEFPPFGGPPGTYLLVLKKPTNRDRRFYDCVVKVEGTFMMPTQLFLQDIQNKILDGIYRDPMIWYAVPFKGKEYGIPVVSEVECLP